MNLTITEPFPKLGEIVAQNDGHCPCAIERSADTLCPCREFREQTVPGLCHCGRYEKVRCDDADSNIL